MGAHGGCRGYGKAQAHVRQALANSIQQQAARSRLLDNMFAKHIVRAGQKQQGAVEYDAVIVTFVSPPPTPGGSVRAQWGIVEELGEMWGAVQAGGQA